MNTAPVEDYLGALEDTTEVVIRVTDVNEPPEFTKSQYLFSGECEHNMLSNRAIFVLFFSVVTSCNFTVLMKRMIFFYILKGNMQ